VKVVIALGGNAIARRGEELDARVQRENVAAAVGALADIVRVHDVVITHGNGPQVGLLAMQGLAQTGTDPYPLDVLGAETEGQIGYLLESELSAVFPNNDVAVLLTQVVVDPGDPAFSKPTKPIGRRLSAAEAHELSERLGWSFAEDGDGARRVVPSPEPREIREIRTISLLLDAGVLVVCAGGGGIPVIIDPAGAPLGVEAVIDKDLTAALLARELEADWLLLLTDVPGIYRDWPRRDQLIERASVDELRAMELDPGSMGPKAEGACGPSRRSLGRE
jgi:carbamate kinase